MSDDVSARRSGLAIAALGSIVLLIALDLTIDYGEGASALHVAIELVALGVAAAGIAALTIRLGRVNTDLARARADAERWRAANKELLNGLASAIENQFASWHLSKAEAEVALLLLKGLSHKEIARVRATSERTIREQSRAVYRKSGLAGRSELAAFFLEDLLLPS